MMDQNDTEFHPHDIVWDEQKTQRLWDYYGSSPPHVSTYFGETVGQHFARVLKRKGLLRHSKRIVDFSCGTGAIINAILDISKHTVNIRGCDLSELSIQRTNQRNEGIPGFGGAHRIEGFPSPIESNSVDLLILTEVLEHLDTMTCAKVLKECARMLAGKGILVVTTPNDEVLGRSYVRCPECGGTFHRWQHVQSFDKNKLQQVLLENGFRSTKVDTITWGNELIELAFKLTRAKPTGLMATATAKLDLS